MFWNRMLGVVLTLTTICSGAQGAELKVLGFLSARPILTALTPDFERTSGHKLTIVYDSVAAMRSRVLAGEAHDVTITSRAALEDLEKQGKIAGITDIARITIRMFVRAGAPKPDISTVEALKRTLLAAETLAYTDPARGGLAGLAFGNALAILGIAAELKPKSKLIQGLGHDVVAAVERGEASLGAAPTNDVTPPSSGIAIIGPLPKELGSDVVISAGLLANAPQKAVAETLIKFLSSQAAAPAIVAGGMEP
jgi:molybdate transport system substrate-binding protein